jgi:geranylgeranyl pyrophosphate synthase
VGTAGAILLSIGLLAKASEVLAQAPRNVEGLVGEWGRTFGLAGMAGGQAVDLSARGPLHGALRRLHREKSTALSAFAVSAGARAAGASEETRAGLHRFGRDLGWAYQLADDAADRAEDRALGRPLGGRNPRRQSERLLLRALGALDATPGLVPGGADLLSSLAELVVPGEGGPPEGRTAC